MVTVTNALLKETDKGPFVVLELSGDLELIQSQKTGSFYGTVRKCKLPCTLDYNTAKAFIGKQIAGSIVRKECTPYQYTAPETGEVLDLTYRWEYVPEEVAKAPVVPLMVSQLVV